MREILTELAALLIFVFPDWNAVADGSRPFHVYCDACIDGFGAALEQEQPSGSVRPITYIRRVTSILRVTGLRLTWKLASWVGPSNAFEATAGARSFASSRITRRSKALAKWVITMRESSGGSSLAPPLTTPSSTARAAPAEMPISCSVCYSLPQNTTALDPAVLPPWKMAASSSSEPLGFAPFPVRSPVLA